MIIVHGGSLQDQDLLAAARNANPAFGRIIDHEVGPVLERFATSSLDYEDGAQNLGLAGQYADINRKVIKLRKAMWDGKPLSGESMGEVLQDLIAHCLLSLDMIHRAVTGHQHITTAGDPVGGECTNPSCILQGPHAVSAHIMA